MEHSTGASSQASKFTLQEIQLHAMLMKTELNNVFSVHICQHANIVQRFLS